MNMIGFEGLLGDQASETYSHISVSIELLGGYRPLDPTHPLQFLEVTDSSFRKFDTRKAEENFGDDSTQHSLFTSCRDYR